MIQGLNADEQWTELEVVATDKRPRVSTGWQEVDVLLHRQSFGPGTFCILAGRMHTRKTAVMVNLIANMLTAGVPVGLVGLDEATHTYVAKLASAIADVPAADLDELWGTPAVAQAKLEYIKTAGGLTLAKGRRPMLKELTEWLEVASVGRPRPRVVFVDYLSLLERNKFAGKDRIPQLCEELQVWTNEQELVSIVLHQVGRGTDTGKKNHGFLPGTPEDMLWGGEQQADVIFQTYRPALDPVGNMRQEDAVAEGHDVQEWMQRRDNVYMSERDTYLQLTKNRPGIRLSQQGIKLKSPTDSQRMVVA